MARSRKILLISNTAWSIYNFRSRLISSLRGKEYDVVVVAPQGDYGAKLSGLGCRYIPLEMDNKGTNPLRDAWLLLSFIKIFLRERPQCVLCYTIKPNIYGSLAGRIAGVPVINNVAGLGTVFSRPSWITPIAKFLYRWAFQGSGHVFFQNANDLRFFQDLGLAKVNRSSLLPGSGVDIDRFRPSNAKRDGHTRATSFLMTGRLLWEKGVGEYVEAARLVKSRFPSARFKLLGFVGVPNPTAVPRSAIDQWVKEGVVEYLGHTSDVLPHLAAADCVVLPSYYGEGTPRSLLEAASIGKPIITTDMPGCRDTVEDGKTGFLVRPRDIRDLADKMETIIGLGPERRASLGLQGRQKMVREFDERIVIEKYLSAIENVIVAPRCRIHT